MSTTPARILFVHAHPDDEASKGAATAAHYLATGARVTLVTCTGGEAGEILNPNLVDIDLTKLAEIRRDELDAACAAIGFSHRYDLGYHDSGFHEDPAAVPEGTYARISADVSGADLATILREERPHVVITYPEDGGYPHPDHIMVHLTTMRGLALAEDPDADIPGDPWRVPRLLATAHFPDERVLGLHHAIEDRGFESPFAGWLESRAEDPGKVRGYDVRVRCDDHFPARDAALLAHATQVDPDGFWFKVPRDIEREVWPHECYSVLRDDAGTTFDTTVDGDLLVDLDLT